MKTHTTFRVGGPADYFVMPETAEEVQRVTELCRMEEVPCYVIGNGSNLLVSDDGYRGVILQIYRSMSGISVQGNIIRAQAGALLSAIAAKACENSLTGFEFAAGIPGTIGGASVMNAGAYGGEMKDVLKSVTVLDSAGQIRRIDRENLEMGYRTSIISREGYITLEAERLSLAQAIRKRSGPGWMILGPDVLQNSRWSIQVPGVPLSVRKDISPGS